MATLAGSQSRVKAVNHNLLATQGREGILSRTLNSNSSVRLILPARIRSPSNNDVVFVGSSSVQLHEFLETGQLVDVTAKLDIGTVITDAKVISAESKFTPVVDTVLNQERDEEQWSIRGRPISENEPPQILVLITKENELVYLYAREDTDGDVQFVLAKRPLVRGASLSATHCREVAVDPESRALAVASRSGYLGIFKLRPVDQIKAQIDSWDPLNHASFRPSEEQRFLQVDGAIHMMTFLRSPQSEPTKVLLLLAVFNEKEEVVYHFLYKWDTRSPLQTIKPMAYSGRAPKEDSFHLMLIPSTHPYSYLAVSELGITYYENVHSSDMKCVNCRFVEKLQGNMEWVQWAKPRRHNQHLERRDDVILLREDGLLQHFEIEKSSSTKFNTTNTIGHLGFKVDTAFCMLAGPPGKGGDIIIVGGSMTDGGVFHVSARGSPERIQTIENISPLDDFIVGPSVPIDAQQPSPHQGRPGRLYACSGPPGRKGQLSEIRYGLEAQIGWTVTFPDAGWVDSLFSVEVPDAHQLLLLASHTTHSSMVIFDLESQDVTFIDQDSQPAIDLSRPTLAMAFIDQQTIVQVTTRSVNLIHYVTRRRVMAGDRMMRSTDHADFFRDDRIIATSTRVASGSYELALISVESSDDGGLYLKSSSSLELGLTVNCICCIHICHTRLVVVGTATGSLLGYSIEPDLTWALAFQHEVQDLNSNVQTSPFTSLVELKQRGTGPSLLLCGLRSGNVLFVELKTHCEDESKIEVKCVDIHPVGLTAVRIVKEQGDSNGLDAPSALILCELAIHRVKLHPNTAVVDYTVSPLWVTDRTNPSAQPLINAVHRIPKLQSSFEQPGGFLVCVTETELLFCSMNTQEHGMVRHLYMDGQPQRLLYSSFLNKFVVAFYKDDMPGTVLPEIPGNAAPIGNQGSQDLPILQKTSVVPSSTRLRRVCLQLVTPHLTYPMGGKFSTVVSKGRDVITDMIDWAPTDGASRYEWIVLALCQYNDASDSNIASGRVVCVNAKSLGKGKPDASPKMAFSSPHRVSAICAYKMSSLLIGTEKEIILHHLDWTTRKWKTLSRHAIPSSATSISCHGSIIRVATTNHSLFVLVERNNQLHQYRADTQVRQARDALTLDGTLDGTLDVLAGDNFACSDVLGFSGLNQQAFVHALVFHATLPGRIRRLRPDLNQQDRTGFYAGAEDGTIFHLSLLKNSEWKLLHFIEEMSYMDGKQIRAMPLVKKDANGKEYVWRTAAFKPKDMHVRGDRLLLMLEHGARNLRNVLRGEERLAAFAALTREVLGDTQQPVEEVVAWMRRLLKYPPRPTGQL